MDAIEAEKDHSDPMQVLYVHRQDQRESFTRYRLQETLMLMGCRPRDAVSVTNEVFVVFEKYLVKQHAKHNNASTTNTTSSTIPKEEGSTISPGLPWHHLHQCIYSSLARLDYTKPHHLLDFQIAKEITQRNQSFVVLLGGTSGTGKSTLASLLAARLRLTTVLPTDSVRHILRAFTSKQEHPCAFVSTYQAGDALSDAVIKELSLTGENSTEASATRLHKRKILRGYKMQSDLVLEKLDRVLTMFERRQQSLVVEGVHLNSEQMMDLVKKHPNCVPFVIYISNELKHRERFAVRARHMTVDPQENKYIKYFNNIRIIQRHLCKNADKYLIPTIDNTNVDRSIASIQSTLIRVLRKMDRGEKIFDAKINKMVLLSREHENSIKKAWSSKGVRKAMRPLINQKVSKRLLLRRLLAEQNSAIFGPTSFHEDSSSSDEDQRGQRKTGQEGEEEEDDDDDDEQTTVVGSLFSGTNTRDHAAMTEIGPTDEIEASNLEDHDGAKMRRSLSLAIQQAAIWRASQQTNSSSDWSTFDVPDGSSDATFSEVIENIPGFVKWKADERRKSWMAGDSTPSVGLLTRSLSSRVAPQHRMNQLPMTDRPQSVLPPLPPPTFEKKSPARIRPRSRRVQSLPPDALDTITMDFDFGSVSMAEEDEEGEDDNDDRVSQSSSRRDECISPLGQSLYEGDSHFETSSQSSNE